mmetsp:Transcript_6457/g.4580  ORF Transcript_6457/g.4580 Transcript_6457/m.4580 type:complete len:199 (+) Transcript_6457:114-710(+)
MSVLVGSKLYVMGGFDGYGCLRDIEMVDLSDEKPQFNQIKPPGLFDPIKNGAAVYNDNGDGQIYIIGGWNEKETTNSVFKFDPETHNQDFCNFMPLNVEGHAIVKINSCVLIFGGFDGYGLTDTIMKMDLNTGSTEVIQNVNLKTKRENHTAQVLTIDGSEHEVMVVVAGGWGPGNVALDSLEMFKYNTNTGQLERLE